MTLDNTKQVTFSHPPLFIDFLKLYKKYYKIHQNLPKLFRVTIGEHIMEELSDGMKLIVMANFNRKNAVQIDESKKFLLSLRGKIELLKAYFLIGWEMKFISHGFFSEINDALEIISKQAYSWSEWFEKQKVGTVA